MVWFTGYLANAVKFISEKQADPCRKELKNTTKTQSSAASEHANETGHNSLWEDVKFIDPDSHWHTGKVKEAIHITLNPNNINRDNGFEIPEAASQRTPEGNMVNSNNSRVETHQLLHTNVIYNAAPETVDPFA